MGKKHIIGYWMVPSLKPTAMLCYIFMLVQIQEKSLVFGESLYVPNLSINPVVLPFLHIRQGQANNFDIPRGSEESISKDFANNDKESRDAVNIEGLDSLRKVNTNRVSPDYFHPEFIGKQSYEEDGRNSGLLNQQNGGYGDPQHQLLQLPPTGFLSSKQFYQSSNPNPKIFNQPNGLLMDKEASLESEANGRLGFLTGFNEFNLPSKHVVVRSRPSRFQVLGPPSTSKRNSVAGVGYMCHFKLCQLGASGKRRWSPVSEND